MWRHSNLSEVLLTLLLTTHLATHCERCEHPRHDEAMSSATSPPGPVRTGETFLLCILINRRRTVLHAPFTLAVPLEPSNSIIRTLLSISVPVLRVDNLEAQLKLCKPLVNLNVNSRRPFPTILTEDQVDLDASTTPSWTHIQRRSSELSDIDVIVLVEDTSTYFYRLTYQVSDAFLQQSQV